MLDWLFQQTRIDFLYIGASFLFVVLVAIPLSFIAWKQRKIASSTAAFMIACFGGSFLLVVQLWFEHPSPSDRLSPLSLVVVVMLLEAALVVLAALPFGIPALLLNKLIGRKSMQVLGCAEHLPSADDLAPHIVARAAHKQTLWARAVIGVVTALSLAGWAPSILERRHDLHNNPFLLEVAEFAMRIVLPLQRATKYPPPDH